MTVEILPYMMDHHVGGNIILAGVEAMQILARCLLRFWPAYDFQYMTDIRFNKFLFISPDTPPPTIFCNLLPITDKKITASLSTKTTSLKTGITRNREHATVSFIQEPPEIPAFHVDFAASIEDVCIRIPAQTIYKKLVRFAPSYQNITGSVHVSKDGVIALIKTPAIKDKDLPLGSPFTLDAAFHAACIWAQRYTHTVAFPVGIKKRIILKKTLPEKTYVTRIVPLNDIQEPSIFDIWIYDTNGVLFEYVAGVCMRDTSRGRLKAPEWIFENTQGPSLPHIRGMCKDVSVIEIKGLAPFADKALSPIEQTRLRKMAHRRKSRYLAARIACKRIYRRLSGNDISIPPDSITTICNDKRLPCCSPPNGKTPYSCSVSHDSRFAIAAASKDRIGVDVEEISDRLIKIQDMYMSTDEQDMVRKSSMGQKRAAVRVWSIKEAATKALGISLADSWYRIRVTKTDHHKSSVIADKKKCMAVHDNVGTHVFTAIRFTKDHI